MAALFLDAHQTRKRPPTQYEDLLADAFERAFGAGADGLDDLALALNRSGPARHDGRPWSAENLASELAVLGAP